MASEVLQVSLYNINGAFFAWAPSHFQAYCFLTELRQFSGFLSQKRFSRFLHEVLLDFLAYSFAHSVNNIFSYLKTNLPIWMYYFKVKIFKCITWAPMKFFSLCNIKMKIFFNTKKGDMTSKNNSHLYWRLFRFHLLCDKCVSTVMFSQQVLLNSVWLVCQICCYWMLNDNPEGLLAFKKYDFDVLHWHRISYEYFSLFHPLYWKI